MLEPTKRDFAKVESIVRREKNVFEGMEVLLAHCEKRNPHPGWKAIARLKFEEDISAIESWLADTLRREPPPASIACFWVGIFNPVNSNGEATCAFHLAGTNSFDPKDKSGDWLCDYTFNPSGGVAKSGVLDFLYKQAYRQGGPGNFAEYEVGLGYTALAIRELCKKVDRKLLLGNAKTRGVAVGFDSGDFVVLESLK